VLHKHEDEVEESLLWKARYERVANIRQLVGSLS